MIYKIARHEFITLFRTPATWLLLAVSQLLLGLAYLFFTRIFADNVNDIAGWLFKISIYLLLFTTPILSTRLMSPDRQNTSLIFLLGKPVSIWQIVIARFLSLLGFALLMLAIPFVITVTLVVGAKPDFGIVFAYCLGILLCTAAFSAISFYLCSLSSMPIVAIASSTLILIFFMFIELFTNTGSAWIDGPLQASSLFGHLNNALRGLLSSNDIIFYITVTFMFLYLTTTRIRRQYG